MKFSYKSLIFLLFWQVFFLSLFFFFVKISFLMLLLVPLLLFNLFLGLFISHFIEKTYSFSSFPEDDFYGVSLLFKSFQKKYPDLKVQLLKSEIPLPLCWTGLQGGAKIAVSASFLESFSREELNCFFEDAFKKINKGDLLFLTLLSAFLYLSLKPSSLLGRSLIFKKSNREQVFLEKWLFQVCSLFTKPLFYKIDQELFQKPEQKKEQALFLQNLESFTRLQKEKLPLFLSPLCLVDPFVGYFKGKKPSSLHPTVKDRSKKLTNFY